MNWRLCFAEPHQPPRSLCRASPAAAFALQSLTSRRVRFAEPHQKLALPFAEYHNDDRQSIG